MTVARAVIAQRTGGPEVLEVVDLELPAAEPGQVVIEVRAAGVNPVDLKRLSGAFGSPTFPLRLGNEVAGVVTAVGADATGPEGPVSVGDEVIAYPVSGGYASAIVAKAGSVFPKPASLAWGEAANLLLTGVTAWHLLEATGVGEGDRVLVHGASGGVGLTVAQLALLRGATVVGTASERNHDLLRHLGVTPVTYGAGLRERLAAVQPDGFTVALDTVGTDEAIDVSLAEVADRSRIATIAAFARGGEAGIRLLGGGPGADPGREIRDAARADLVRLAGSGAIRVDMGREFPLEDVATALELVATGHPGGQVALLP